MRTLDRTVIMAPPPVVFRLASEVERWPTFLAHYRHVRRVDDGLVEMAAWRPFGPLRYPVWWVSEMRIDHAQQTIRYRHVRGITRGMDVEWRLAGNDEGVDVEIEHVWPGPSWPLVGRPAARWVIGPVFIHGIARRTLAGIKRQAER